MATAIGGPRVLLRQLREVMAEPLPSQERLDKIVDLIAVNMRTDVCSFYVLRDDGALELFATHGLKLESVHLTTLRLGEGLVGLIAAEAEPLALENAPAHPAAYVQRAAINFFIKERQRERERLPRELRGGHLVIEAHLDDRLTAGEEQQYVEALLARLTQAQREVIRLVMDGWSAREIAEKLGKSAENVRQHLKNGRDILKLDPGIASLAPEKPLDRVVPAPRDARSTSATPATPEPKKKEEVQ